MDDDEKDEDSAPCKFRDLVLGRRDRFRSIDECECAPKKDTGFSFGAMRRSRFASEG